MITPENLVSELTNIVSELSMIESKLMNLDNESLTLEVLEDIESEVSQSVTYLPQIIQFVADTKPSPEVIGTRLKDSINKVTEIIRLLTEYRNNFKNQ